MTVINTNTSALTAQAGQRTAQMGLSMAMERLSTGQRINSAKDDAAGLAISQRMTADVRGRSADSIPWKFRDHALFIAFAPVKEPRYAIAVVVEHGGGGSKIAAPIAKEIMTLVAQRDPARQKLFVPPSRAASTSVAKA